MPLGMHAVHPLTVGTENGLRKPSGFCRKASRRVSQVPAIPIIASGGVPLQCRRNAQKTSVSAITKLAWVQRQEDGFMMQRVGSCLLFMDPAGQEQLMEQAYAGLLSNATKWGGGSPS